MTVRAAVALLIAALLVSVPPAAAGDGQTATPSPQAKQKVKKKKCMRTRAKGKPKQRAKCKRRKGKQRPVAAPVPVPPVPPVPAPPAPVPTVRAEVTWDTETQLDLHVYDEWGNHAYWDPNRSQIPDARVEDAFGFGPERFIDLREPSTRVFSYYVCYTWGEGAGDPPTIVNAVLTDPGGAQRGIIPVLLNAPGDFAYIGVSPPTAAPHPVADGCQEEE